MKTLLAKTSRNVRIETEGFQRGLLESRNTPGSHGKSPAEIVVGYPLHSFLPAHRSTFVKKWRDDIAVRDKVSKKIQEKARVHYDAHAHPMRTIPVGTTVRVKDPKTRPWDKRGIVMSIGKRHDYRVKLPSGRILWRNWRYVREDFLTPATTTAEQDSTNDDNHYIISIKRREPGTGRHATSEDIIPRRSIRESKPPDQLMINP